MNTVSGGARHGLTVVAYSENLVQYVLPDDFFGIQIVQNSISAGGAAPNHIEELMILLQTPVSCGRDTPSLLPTP